MRRFNRFAYFFFLSMVLLSCAYTRHSTIAAYLTPLTEFCEVRAADTIPPVIPAIKENEERTESRILWEEFFFAVIIIALLISHKTLRKIALETENTSCILSKYRKNVISLQTIK